MIDKLKKYESKKTSDNFTQTIFMLKNLNLEHRFTQTIPQIKPFMFSAFTQTPRLISQNFSTQTVRLNYRNVAVQTDGLTALYDASKKQNLNKIEYKEFNQNLGLNKDGWDLGLLISIRLSSSCC